MKVPNRIAWRWWLVTTVFILAIPGPAMAQELEVTAGDGPGHYLVAPVKGNRFEISLSVPGLDTPEGETWSAREAGTSFDLVLIRIGDSDQHQGRVVVPLDGPGRIRVVRAFMSGDLVLVAIRMDFERYGSPGENGESRWVVVELGPEPKVLQNSAVSHGGRCDQHSLRSPQPMIEPRWQAREDRLWMTMAVDSFLCYSDAGEDRGVIEWKIGEPPQPVSLLFPEKLQILIREAQTLGFQPYSHFHLGRGLDAILAEYPTSMGGSRLLVVVDKKGRDAMLFLPQLGYEPTWKGRPVDRSEASREKTASFKSWLDEQWPQLRATEAFQFSEDFLSARPEPLVTTLLRNRRVSIIELAMPCVGAVNPAPSGVENERWLLRVERGENEMKIEAALIEPCSLAMVGRGVAPYQIPLAEVEVMHDAVRVFYPLPKIDVEALAEDKFLFHNLRGLIDRHSTAAIRMRLNGPTVTVPRCEPALPTTGRGWLAAETEGCRLNVRFWWGGQYPEDQTPPRFIEPPLVAHWCAAGGGKPELRRLNVDLGADGTVKGYLSTYPSWPVPKELIDDILGWRISPAKDAGGMPAAVTMRIEVSRDLPQPEQPSVCQ